MRFHVVGLPHTETTKAYSWCAYTQKVRKFCDMMSGLGHEVILYAGQNNEADAQVVVHITNPKNDPDNIPEFSHLNPTFKRFNNKVIKEIKLSGVEPRDFLCIIGGSSQQPIAAAFPEMMCVEYGVGYGGTFAPYRVFESYAWMHTVYGAHTGGNAHDADGFFFDDVIPNYFDVREFEFVPEPQDYLFYIGRLIDRKGWRVAVEIAEQTGKRLLIAGAGDPGPLPSHCTYMGVVDPGTRSVLLGNAAGHNRPQSLHRALRGSPCGVHAVRHSGYHDRLGSVHRDRDSRGRKTMPDVLRVQERRQRSETPRQGRYQGLRYFQVLHRGHRTQVRGVLRATVNPLRKRILRMTINGKYVSPSALLQHVLAYAAVVMGVLTTQLQGVHLPAWGSAILGIFGILLHPWTSVTSTSAPAQAPAPPTPQQ